MTTQTIDSSQSLDASNVNSLEEFIEMQEALASNVDFRANVAPGTALGEENLGEGSKVRWKKSNSMVSMGGQPLPERTPVYDTRTNVVSMVPTAQLLHHLRKRRPDGSRVFSSRPDPNIPMPKPIDDTCLVCLPLRGGKPRNFYNKFDLIAHYEISHPREWRVLQDEERAGKQSNDSTSLQAVLQQLVNLFSPDAVRKALAESVMPEAAGVTPGPEPRHGGDSAECEQCGFVAKNAFGLQAHTRNKHGGD